MQRLQVVFAGSVQGVGFRATARHLAAGFAVTGWVRNEPDGTVLMEVQGAALEVNRFLGALRERLSKFIRSERSTGAPTLENETGFNIRA